jgi:hypothetical protein
MDTIRFDRTTEARGRNGWFHLDHGELFGDGEHRWLDLYAKLSGKSAPITLRFANPADMQTLAQALQEAATAWQAQRDRPKA